MPEEYIFGLKKSWSIYPYSYTSCFSTWLLCLLFYYRTPQLDSMLILGIYFPYFLFSISCLKSFYILQSNGGSKTSCWLFSTEFKFYSGHDFNPKGLLWYRTSEFLTCIPVRHWSQVLPFHLCALELRVPKRHSLRVMRNCFPYALSHCDISPAEGSWSHPLLLPH